MGTERIVNLSKEVCDNVDKILMLVGGFSQDSGLPFFKSRSGYGGE